MVTTPFPAAPAAPAFDAGLRDHMARVYRYLAGGLALSAATAFAVRHVSVTGTHAEGAVQVTKALWLTPAGEFLLGWKALLATGVASILVIIAMWRALGRASYLASAALYLAFTVLFGPLLVMATVRYSASSVIQVLSVTTAVFGAMSLYGYTTRRDLTGLGSFLFMGLLGLVGVGLVNVLFLHSSALQTLAAAAGVLVFVGYTAYDTQRIKEAYSERLGSGEAGALAVWGAMELYLDFVNLFVDLLRLMGDAEVLSGIGNAASSAAEGIGEAVSSVADSIGD